MLASVRRVADLRQSASRSYLRDAWSQGGDAVDSWPTWARDWRYVCAVITIVAVFVLDLMFPTVTVAPFMCVPVVAAATFARPLAVASLAGLAVGADLVAGWVGGDFANPEYWVRMAILVVFGIVAVVVAGAAWGWRHKLADSEARARVLAENATDVVFEADVDGHLTWVSPSITAEAGWGDKEMVGRGLVDVVHADDAQALRKVLDRVALGEAGAADARLQTSSSGYRWIAITVRPNRDESGAVVGLLGGWRDTHAEHEAQEVLERSESRYRLLANNVGDVVYTAGLDRVVTWVSPSVQSKLGWTPEELVGTVMGDLLHPDDREPTEEERRQLYSGERADALSSAFVVRLRTREGQDRWMSAVLSPLTSDGGSQVGVVGSLSPVDELVQARQEAQKERSRLQATLDSLLDPHVMLDAVRDGNGRVVDFVYADANDAACKYNGVAREDLVGSRLLDVHPGHAGTGLLATYAGILDSGEPLALDSYAYPNEVQQEERYYDIRAVKVGDTLSYTWRDVTDRHETEAALLELATHDPLTGLANRSAVTSEIRRALSAGMRSGRSTAVLMVDLDRFKDVNDTLGHAVGDDLLQDAAERLASGSRCGDLLARLGGDEFIVVMRDLAGPTEATEAASRLVDLFRRPFQVSDNELYATASIGIAVSSESTTPEDMLREADTALYVAKEAGRDQCVTFNETLRTQLKSRLSLESGLRHALERGQLATWYQPEVDLSTGLIVAVEALLRWHHPDGETLEADRFIDVAEQTGLILEIGESVLNAACVQAAAWAADRPDHPIRMRVNASALQLAGPGLLDSLDRALNASFLDPGLLCIEITETALLRETASVRANLAGIRARGVRLALDDFGTGYASLSYLRRFPVDVVKIDRSFITQLSTIERDRQLLEAIVALSTTLGMTVTAEGVETVDQCSLVRQLGCSGAQGYLFSRAAPADRITELMDNRFAVA
jgi:diguanylate cyclase (GGDEF)-like protein/PAS domain S-box-containing protein